MLNAFIKHQKERSSERLLKQLIERTLSFEMKSRLHETEALIPVPPKVPGQQDHAFRIAKVLSELMGKPIVMPLRSKSASPQKRLSKTDRKAIAFEKIPVNFANHHRLTLVDDVITTGQTMNAMVAALEGVQKFHLFSLAQRVLIDPTRDKC
ncbi:MAG: hypothetical protein LW875_02420 [Proteobacteria bacterium]|jgi:predicted amidophosphoribosyltransferase|nr:hypothetical protein [Pseudomonadota bacterium]